MSCNPALDRVALVDDAAAGGTVRARTYLDTPGGKAIHVGLVARSLGARSEVIVALGGARGQRIGRLLDDAGLVHTTVVIAGETRGTYTVVDARSGDLIEVLEPAPAVTPGEIDDLLGATEAACRRAAIVVTAGSLPTGAPADLHARIVALAHEHGALSIVDASGAALAAALEARPSLVKPNLAEAGALAGVALPHVTPPEDLVPVALELQRRGAASVWLSLGAQGSLLATEDGRTHHLSAPAVTVVNAVGCGDALVGGLAAGLSRGLGLLDAARLGAGAAADKLSHLHPGLVDRAGAERLSQTVTVRRIG